MRNILSIIIVLSSILARGEIVKGRLTNNNNEPVPFASILLFNSADTSIVKANISDSTGIFNIISPNPNTFYFLEIQTINYKNHLTETFKGNKNFNQITLETDNKIKEVELTFQKPMFEVTGRGMIVNVEASPILSSGNTQDIL